MPVLRRKKIIKRKRKKKIIINDVPIKFENNQTILDIPDLDSVLPGLVLSSCTFSSSGFSFSSSRFSSSGFSFSSSRFSS